MTTRYGLPLAVGLCLVLLAGCEAPGASQTSSRGAVLPPMASDTDIEARIAEVTREIRALGPGIDAKEAARAARIAVRHSLKLAQDWQVIDPPLLHNIKVTNGFRDKGVCRDWANALHAALRAERFHTLELHIGMANARNAALEHVSLVVTARGRPMHSGLLLDPWRVGQGRLWTGRVTEDPRYDWETLEAVRAWTRAWQARAGQ